jgi:hypothetical protein
LISCRCNLVALSAHLGIPHQNAHNAMADTLVTIEVARRFYDLMQPAVQAALPTKN